MEVNSMETPLLSSNDHEVEVNKPNLTGLVSTMKSNFFTDLPQKLRSQIDPESPFDLDVSKAGLKRGKKCLIHKLYDIVTTTKTIMLPKT